MNNIEYQWSDIWLLHSIIIGGGENGASLYNIISTGDALNHAIFTNDELKNGFSRLTSGGLIMEENSLFFPTEKAKDIYKKAEKRGGSNIYNIRKHMGNMLEAAPYDPNQKYPNPKDNLSYPGFSSKAVEEAIEQWHKEARRILKGK
jgi:hypothetical protein